MNKIVLVFICRDNADTIVKMIESCLPIIDRIVATDTGSKDNTKDLIFQTAQAKVPVHVFEEPWQNFAHNRTVMMRNAKSCCAPDDYLLIMDTDETLEIKPEFNKDSLNLDAYLVNSFSGDMFYYRERIVSNRFEWIWQGYAHEFMVSPPEVRPYGKVEGLTMIVHPKPDAFASNIIRNYKLLLKEYKERPDDPRTVFYLGESCKDLRWLDDAIYYYTLRARMGGFAEEVYYAILQLGIVYKWKGDKEQAKNCFYSAIEKRPRRAEAMYELAMIHKEENRHDLAVMYFERILNMPETDDMLFVNSTIKEYQAKFHLSISLYWTGEYKKSLKYALELTEQNLPADIKDQNFKNITYTRQRINEQFPDEKTLVISVPWAWDGLGDTLFLSHIPKLAKEVGGYKYVYVNRAHAFKSPGTQELVWGINPYVDGFTDEYDLYHDDQQWVHWTLCGLGDIRPPREKFQNNAMLHRLMKIYKLDDPNFDGLPWVSWYHIMEKNHDSQLDLDLIRRSVIFDGNWKAHIGLEEADVQEFFKTNRKPDLQFAPVNHPKSEVGGAESKCIVIPDVPVIKVRDIFEYALVLAECKLFIGLMSGGPVLAAALRKPCVVLDSKKTTQMHHFEEFNWHIYLDREERTYQQIRDMVNGGDPPPVQEIYRKSVDPLVSCNSLLSNDRLESLRDLLISVEKLEGSVMEIGCYKGGASRFLAQHTKETVLMVDTFKGLPVPGPNDNHHQTGEFSASIHDVKGAMQGLSNWMAIQGEFPFESSAWPTHFKFVHLDVDLYESTLRSLEWLRDKMVKGGIVVIDDYGSPDCQGVTMAVDQFCSYHQYMIQFRIPLQAHIIF